MLDGKISLSQIDYRFLTNITKQVEGDKGITTNQATLFDKLVQKYSRQLKKNHVDPAQVITLDWHTQIISSTVEFTGARVYVEGDNIVFKVPFNNKFIHNFNKERNAAFAYQKDTKSYVSRFSTRSLKYAATILPEFFSTIQYDQTIKTILDELKAYEAGFYNPTLVDINGLLVVVACNSVLADIIKDIPLTKTPQCIEVLTSLGVEIDPNLIGSDAKLEFASNKYGELSQENMKQTITWLEELGYTGYIIPRASANMKIARELVEELEYRSSMKAFNPSGFTPIPPNQKLVVFPHIKNFNVGIYMQAADNTKVKKILVLKDSTSIEVK